MDSDSLFAILMLMLIGVAITVIVLLSNAADEMRKLDAKCMLAGGVAVRIENSHYCIERPKVLFTY